MSSERESLFRLVRVERTPMRVLRAICVLVLSITIAALTFFAPGIDSLWRAPLWLVWAGFLWWSPKN